MNTFTLLGRNEVCLAILSMQVRYSNASTRPEGIDTKLFELSQLKASDLKSMQKKLETSSISDVLESSGLVLHFHPNELETIMSNRQLLPELTIYYVLTSFLAFEVLFSKSLGFEHVHLVLDSLLCLLSDELFIRDQKGQTEIIATSAFANTVREIARNADVSVLLEPLGSYLVSARTLHPDVLDLTLTVTQMAIGVNAAITGDVQHLTESLIRMLEKRRHLVPKSFVSAILRAHSNAVVHLDPNALQVFQYAATALEQHELILLLDPLMTDLLLCVREKVIPDYEPAADDWGLIELDMRGGSGFNLPRDKNMLENVRQSEILPGRVKFEKLMSEGVYIKMTLLTGILLSQQVFVDAFMSVTEIVEIDRRANLVLEQYAIFFHVYDHAIDFLMATSPPPLSVLNDPIFWDPKVTVFHKGKNAEYIGTFRDVAVKSFLLRSPEFLNDFLLDMAMYPLLYGEIVLRMRWLIDSLIGSEDVTHKKLVWVIDGIMNPLLAYRQCRDCDAVKQVRKVLLDLLDDLMHIDRIKVTLLSCKKFVKRYILLLLEPPIRQEVLPVLSDYLVQVDLATVNLREGIVSLLSRLVQLKCSEPDDDCEGMLIDLITMVNDAVAYRHELSGHLKWLASGLCRSAMAVESIRESKEILMLLISFLTLTAGEYVIKSGDICGIEDAITRKINEKSKPEIMSKLGQMIAGRPMSVYVANFTIQQPKIARSFLRIFSKTDYLFESVGFIADLCSYSVDNCIQCHKGEVDLYLLDQIREFCHSTEDDKGVVSLYLKLFMQIAQVASSVHVVRRYVSLLCPVDAAFLSRIHVKILDTFSQILIGARKVPNGALSLCNGNSVKVTGLNGRDIKNGFTFSFWFYACGPTGGCCKSLLKVVDSKEPNNIISIKLNGDKITVEVAVDYDAYECDIDECSIPIHAWSMMSLTFIQDESRETADVQMLLNDKFVMTVNSFGPYQTKNDLIAYINSPVVTEDMSDDDIVLLGPVFLFERKTREEIASLFEKGPRVSISASMKPLFCFDPVTVGDKFLFQSMYSDCKAVAEYKNLKTVRCHSFFDLFLDFCKPSIILPIFAQIDIPGFDGVPIPNLGEMAVDILKSLCSLGWKTQKLLTKCSSFHIISHLLQSWNDRHITLSLYLQFFDIMSVASDEQLRTEMFDLIITNIELWRKSSQADLLRILKHWLRTVYPAMKTTFDKSITLQWILFAMREYFTYNGLSSPDDIQWCWECRQTLSKLAIQVSKMNLSPSDIYCVLGYLLEENNDWRAKVDLLQFLSTVFCQSQETPSDGTRRAMSGLMTLLQELLSSKYDVIIVETIVCIANIYKLNWELELVPFPEEVLRMIRFVQFHSFSDWALGKLIDFMNSDFPELLPLVCMIAVNNGERAIMRLVRSASRGQFYWCDQISAAWPVAMLFTVENRSRVEVADFLVSVFGSNFERLYCTICVIGKTKPLPDTEEIKAIVLLIMGNRPTYSRDTAKFLLRMMKQLLFYRQFGTPNQALHSLWNESPFNPANDWRPHSSQTPDVYEDIEFREEYHFKHIPQFRHGHRTVTDRRLLDESNVKISVDEDGTQQSILVGAESQCTDVCDHYAMPDISLYGQDLMAEQVRQSESQYHAYSFGLRFGPRGGWIDLDLAKMALTIFKKKQIEQYPDFICIVLCFLDRVEPGTILREQKLVQFLKQRLSEDYTVLLKSPRDCDTTELFERLSMLADLDMWHSIARLSSVIASTVASNIFLEKQHKKNVVEQIARVISARSASTYEWMNWNSKKWARLWRSLTISKAPWHESIPVKEINYKRDKRFGFCFCPMRLKQDMHLRDYLRASLLRDTGNHVVTDLKIAEIRSRGEREAPAALLFKVDDIEKDDKSPKSPCQIQKAHVSLDCIIKTTVEEIQAKLVIDKDALILSANKYAQIIKASDIVYMLYRMKCHKWRGFEIFTKSNTSILLYFEGERFRTLPLVMRMMPSINPECLQLRMFPQFVEGIELSKRWCNREITNFQFLMLLNLFSGRSFNDLAIYPYFPWIIRDYESTTLDIENPQTFRDLSRPIGAIDEERRQDLLDHARELERMKQTPFLYSSCASNSLSVCLYLLRVEPFTSQHIAIQGGKFDHATRVFKSVGATYKMVTTLTNDYRELVPEFFYFPEMFVNNNRLDLGKTDEGVVNDVVLPPWAKNAFDFVYKHRQALESEYVSQHLHEWIDLTWGYKQKGPEAWKAANVYFKEAYEDVWADPKYKSDIALKSIAEQMQESVGQIPCQLFNEPHPQRNPPREVEKLSPVPFTVTVAETGTVVACRLSHQGTKQMLCQLLDDLGYSRSVHVVFSQLKKACDTGKELAFPSSPRGKQTTDSARHFTVDKPSKIFEPKGLLKAVVLDEAATALYEIGASDLRICNGDKGKDKILSFPIEVNRVASSNDGWFVVACADARVMIFHKTEEIGAISTFRESIECATILSSQDMLICGTKDKSLLLCSLHRATVYRVVELSGTPRNVVMTESLPMVAVEIKQVTSGMINRVLALYTVNGVKINETVLKSKTRAMATFVDSRGFDHLIVADAAGDVYAFEAYPLEFGPPILHVESPVVSCYFCVSTVFVVCEDGSISMISV